ncbi:hypothetical protein TNCV_763221 [Trichonephila clavipes]|nr:hypothetical protein TNCV_763221 [Trichonephila clavipes]
MYQNLCRFRCSRTCADSSVTSPTATYADSKCIRTCADSVSQVPQSPVKIPPLQSLPEPMQLYQSSIFGPFGVDRCIRPAHALCIWTQELLAAFHTVPSHF